MAVENSERSLHATTWVQLTNGKPKKLVKKKVRFNSICKSSFTSSRNLSIEAETTMLLGWVMTKRDHDGNLEMVIFLDQGAFTWE